MTRELFKLSLYLLSLSLFAFVPANSAKPCAHADLWPPSPAIKADSPGFASMDSEILTYVNEDRKQHGLTPLKMNAVESAIAEKHSRDMANGKIAFGHGGLNARVKTIRKALGDISAVGENVASGPMSAREVVDGWLNSPGHKRNIEGNFTLTGIGYAPDKKGNIFFTQIFSR